MGATIYQHLTYKEAQAESLRRLGDLITEKCEDTSIGAKISKNLALPPKPLAKPGELMLDAAIHKYIENVATKSFKTSRGLPLHPPAVLFLYRKLSPFERHYAAAL